jgi:Arc/MetJ-type ribon-helix-helix transcriptional regulator
MEIELSKDLEQIINSAMLTGKFKSPEECIVEGIKALKLQWLNDELQGGLDELERGEGEPYDRDKIIEEVEKQLKDL